MAISGRDKCAGTGVIAKVTPGSGIPAPQVVKPKGGFPVLGYILIAVGAVMIVVGLGVYCWNSRKKSALKKTRAAKVQPDSRPRAPRGPEETQPLMADAEVADMSVQSSKKAGPLPSMELQQPPAADMYVQSSTPAGLPPSMQLQQPPAMQFAQSVTPQPPTPLVQMQAYEAAVPTASYALPQYQYQPVQREMSQQEVNYSYNMAAALAPVASTVAYPITTAQPVGYFEQPVTGSANMLYQQDVNGYMMGQR
eukprot:TRINITY_DN109299_c0_g1_i1.p1 TRINITY_DN109299_c0_g1~~TRINITY_DN109299_c0_g1_i1.p1  ORF type:complete len:274 (+),score=50.67 TRINITY_DN109299_c0_g1_i1:67-822(+)